VVPVATRAVIVRPKDKGPWSKDDLLNTLVKRFFGYRFHQQLIHTRIAGRLDHVTVSVSRDHDNGRRLHLLIRQTPKRVNKGEAIHGLHHQIRENKLRLAFGNPYQCRVSVPVLDAFDSDPLQQPMQKHAHVLIVINNNGAQTAL
jgi:hypothetical protein